MLAPAVADNPFVTLASAALPSVACAVAVPLFALADATPPRPTKADADPLLEALALAELPSSADASAALESVAVLTAKLAVRATLLALLE